MPSGTRLILIWPSGNRDEQRFPDAERFDITCRDAQQHLGFGRGVHFCTGAALARLEGRIALELLLERLSHPRLQPGAKLEYWPNLFMRGYQHLPRGILALRLPAHSAAGWILSREMPGVSA